MRTLFERDAGAVIGRIPAARRANISSIPMFSNTHKTTKKKPPTSTGSGGTFDAGRRLTVMTGHGE